MRADSSSSQLSLTDGVVLLVAILSVLAAFGGDSGALLRASWSYAIEHEGAQPPQPLVGCTLAEIELLAGVFKVGGTGKSRLAVEPCDEGAQIRANGAPFPPVGSDAGAECDDFGFVPTRRGSAAGGEARWLLLRRRKSRHHKRRPAARDARHHT